MSIPISGVDSPVAFEKYAQQYFSTLFGVDLQKRTVMVAELVPWIFDLVSTDYHYVGDAKWFLHNKNGNGAKSQAIAEYIWLLQKVKADKVFLVFGRDAEVAEEYLKRIRLLASPLEFYYLDGSGHRLLYPV